MATGTRPPAASRQAVLEGLLHPIFLRRDKPAVGRRVVGIGVAERRPGRPGEMGPGAPTPRQRKESPR